MDKKIDHRECPDDVVEDARKFYEGYIANSDGLNFRGEPCPPWDELNDAVKSHWCATVYVARRVHAEKMR